MSDFKGTLIEVDQNTGYRIYLTDVNRFAVNGQFFDSFVQAKDYCYAMYASY